jgi:hypothetical protein
VAAVTAELSPDQKTVLQLVYDKFRLRSAWPTFDDIDRPARRAGLDPVAVIQAIPHTLIRPFQAGRTQPVPNDTVHLTIEGIAASDGGSEDVQNFLRLLPWFAERELNFEPEPDALDRHLKIHSTEIKEFLGLPEGLWEPMFRLHKVLEQERWGSYGGGSQDDFAWYVMVSRDIARFAQVRTVADYVAAQDRWDQEDLRPTFAEPLLPDRVPAVHTGRLAAPSAPAAASRRLPVPQVVEAETYVAARVIRMIEDKAPGSAWSCDKLLQLIKELNDNHTRRNTYSAHALLRAILDHVPPMLGCADFTAVVNNYSWGRTDKGYMRQLKEFRVQGDDMMHRQISKSADVLRFGDLPTGAGLNRLLQECADRL